MRGAYGDDHIMWISYHYRLPHWYWSLHITLQWRHMSVMASQITRRSTLFFRSLLRPTSKKASELRVTGFLWGEPPAPGGFASQRVSNEEIISISWRHHGIPGYQSWHTSQDNSCLCNGLVNEYAKIIWLNKGWLKHVCHVALLITLSNHITW